MTVKEHIENSFWAFEQIVSMKDEIDKMVNSKLGATHNERHGPEKGIDSLKFEIDWNVQLFLKVRKCQSQVRVSGKVVRENPATKMDFANAAGHLLTL